MLFQTSYFPIRASSVLYNSVCFIFSLQFATFIYASFPVFYLLLYLSSFFPPLLPIVLFSYFLHSLFTELKRVIRLLPSIMSSFLLSLYVYILSFSPSFIFISSSSLWSLFFPIIFPSIFFVASFLSDDCHSLFLSVTSLPFLFLPPFLSVFTFHIRVLCGSLTVNVTNATQYWIIHCNTFFCLPVTAHVYWRSSRHSKRAGRAGIWKMISCDRISLFHFYPSFLITLTGKLSEHK